MYRQGALLASRYRLDERVGGGGMGEVWRGTDTELERTVAVKTVRAELLDEPGFRERFRAEARTMARIRHPGVVAVHDYYSDESGAFLVMEFIEGESLSQTLRRLGRLDPGRTMRLIADAADALQAAHDQGVVHRDIKPANLMLSAGSKLVLTDFGIARSAASTSLTATGALIGTASYLAPEQVLGRPATPRSDVYALGVVAYECLAGRRPFDGENPFDVALQRLREPPPPLPGDVPPQVRAVVERALAAEPEQRWESATAVAIAARQAAEAVRAGTPAAPPGHADLGRQPSSAPPVSPPYPSPSRSTSQPVTPPRPPVTPVPPPAVPPPPAPVYAPPVRHAGTGGYVPPRPPPSGNTNLGTLSLAFGAASVPLACCYVGAPLAVAAVVMGVIGLRKAMEGHTQQRGYSIAGLACGSIGILLVLLTVLLGLTDALS